MFEVSAKAYVNDEYEGKYVDMADTRYMARPLSSESSQSSAQLIVGDAIERLRELPPNSIYAVVTDSPYGRGTLHNAPWDTKVAFYPAIWREVLRVLRPGAWMLTFAATRTFHRVACAQEDAGFEIFDMLAWLYSSGFPRSKSQVAAIDAAGGNGADWAGYGTALKPALEPICLARKPRVSTVASNIVNHGTGLLNVDGCRIGVEVRYNPPASNKPDSGGPYLAGKYGMPVDAEGRTATGRYPANVLLDEVVAEHDADLAQYFLVAKPSKAERTEGGGHPTQKPVALMRHLVRLVTPPGGIVLDPFMGSGSTGVAALAEGFHFVGIDLDQKWVDVAKRRMSREAT